MTCPKCFAELTNSGSFCTQCGTPTSSEVIPSQPVSEASVHGATTPDQVMARGFGYIFNLHPGIAFFIIAVNMMLFGADGLGAIMSLATGGAGIPIVLLASVLAGAAVGYVTYLGQIKWCGDDHESARVRAVMTAVLTAIPSGLPGALFGSAALAGLLWRKKS